MSRKNKSYKFELKLKVVLAYLNGEGSHESLAKKYGIATEASIRKWVYDYRQYGADGLRKVMKKNSYSGEYKLSVLQYRKLHELTYKETARHFKIKNFGMIKNWQNRYDKEGMAGLQSKKRKQTKEDMLDKKTTNQSDQVKDAIVEEPLSDSERQELKRLRKENEFLKVSLAYEKKLQALIHEENLEAKKKRNW
ncbi:MAG: helix-turn-helix domain-containing protein [Saccharofermentanales bacterium]|jgi:transposase